MPNDNIHLANRQVTTVTPSDTTEIQLRVIDWKRIYRKIKGVRTEVSSRELFAGVAWGITASALLSLVPLYQATQSTDAWVKPTFWIIALASLITGIIIWINMRDYSQDVQAAREEILIDMREIHCIYFPNETPDT